MKKYNNKATLALQIVFTVICAAVAITALTMVCICAADRGNDGFGIVLALYLIIGIYFILAAGILLIPFILLMVFCQKPWIALAGYLFLILSLVIFYVVLISLGNAGGQALVPFFALTR